MYCDKSLGHVAVENPGSLLDRFWSISSSNCEFLRDRGLRALVGAEGEVPEMFRETYFLDPSFFFPDLFVGVNGPLDDDSASSTFWTYKTAFRKKRAKERRKCLREGEILSCSMPGRESGEFLCKILIFKFLDKFHREIRENVEKKKRMDER